MNVTHIISGDVWGGAESQAFQLILDLDIYTDLSIYVIVFNDNILYKKLLSHNIKVILIEESSNSLLFIINKIFLYLKKNKIDVVHFHGFKENFLGGIAARFMFVKTTVRTHHGRGMLNSGIKFKFLEIFNYFLLTDIVVTVSSELNVFLKNYFKIYSKNKISTVRNGINIDSICVNRKSKEIKNYLKISDKSLVIGTVGRFVKEKGHLYLIEATKILRDNGYNVSLIILGDGLLYEEYIQKIKKLELSEHVFMPGFVNEVYDFVNVFDVFVLTSLNEGIPIALLEAMALNKAIVSTYVGGVPEIIKNGYNGILIPPENSNACANACRDLIDNTDLIFKLSVNAKKSLENNFLSQQSALEIKKLYELS